MQGSNHWSGGVRRRPTLPVRCPATDAAASAHESAPERPGRGCDNTLRLAMYLPARHGSGTKEVPARRPPPHVARPSTSHQPAHTTGTVAAGDGTFSPGRASVARNGTRPDATTSVWPSVHRQLHAQLSTQRGDLYTRRRVGLRGARRPSVHRSAGTGLVDDGRGQ